MGYRWDKDRKCFYFFERKSKTRIYNFDVPSERIHVAEDQPDEEMQDAPDHQVASLIHLSLDSFVKCLGHALLIYLSWTDISEARDPCI